MSRRPNDLTGRRFGRLVAIAPTKERNTGHVVWECKCDCGTTCYKATNVLMNGASKSCGCFKRESSRNRYVDITGKRYGRLTVVKRSDVRLKNLPTWECLCDCGKTVYVPTTRLNAGKTRSCGCLFKDVIREVGSKRTIDLTNQRFGRLIALKQTDQKVSGSYLWECVCDCGNTCLANSATLRRGGKKSCGCLRSGPKKKVEATAEGTEATA